MRPCCPGLLLGALLALPAAAEAPRVAADIAPVHSLAARVMEGVGEPALILPPGASPHDHAMRPSEAGALQDADVVIWMGEALTPWLGGAIDRLAGDAAVLPLLEVEGTGRLPLREGAVFGQVRDDGAHGEGEDAGHEGHEGEAHADGAQKDGVQEESGHGHGHGDADAHAWLDPDNATLWLDAIAAALGEIDPEHAARYAANARDGRAEIEAEAAEAEALLAPLRGRPFVVAHDAYGHFEARFGVPALGAIEAGDAAPPSPRRLDAIRKAAAAHDALCVLAEPGADPALARAAIEDARIVEADPLGARIEPGAALYPRLLRELAAALAECLSETG